MRRRSVIITGVLLVGLVVLGTYSASAKGAQQKINESVHAAAMKQAIELIDEKKCGAARAVLVEALK